MARNAKYYNSDNSPVLACTHGRYSHAFKSEWFQHPPCTAEQAEWLIHSYRRRGLPLCRKHHNELHTDTVAFEDKYGSQLELIFRFIDRALAIGVLA